MVARSLCHPYCRHPPPFHAEAKQPVGFTALQGCPALRPETIGSTLHCIISWGWFISSTAQCDVHALINIKCMFWFLWLASYIDPNCMFIVLFNFRLHLPHSGLLAWQPYRCSSTPFPPWHELIQLRSCHHRVIGFRGVGVQVWNLVTKAPFPLRSYIVVLRIICFLTSPAALPFDC